MNDYRLSSSSQLRTNLLCLDKYRLLHEWQLIHHFRGFACFCSSLKVILDILVRTKDPYHKQTWYIVSFSFSWYALHLHVCFQSGPHRTTMGEHQVSMAKEMCITLFQLDSQGLKFSNRDGHWIRCDGVSLTYICNQYLFEVNLWVRVNENVLLLGCRPITIATQIHQRCSLCRSNECKVTCSIGKPVLGADQSSATPTDHARVRPFLGRAGVRLLCSRSIQSSGF